MFIKVTVLGYFLQRLTVVFCLGGLQEREEFLSFVLVAVPQCRHIKCRPVSAALDIRAHMQLGPRAAQEEKFMHPVTFLVLDQGYWEVGSIQSP